MTAPVREPLDRWNDTQVDVVHVITTLTAGGAERQLELLTAHSRHTSSVVTLYEAGLVADGIRAQGHHVEELHATGWRKLVAPLVLARRLRRLAPRVVHVHLLSGQLLGIPAARLAGVPLVVSTEHSLMDDTIEGRPHTWWLRLLYRALERMTSHTVAVSEATAQRLQRWGVRPDRVSVAELGVDLDAVAFDAADRAATRQELGIGPDTPVVGVVGRLAPVKRIDVALRACAPLLRQGGVLVVAGTGPLERDLRGLATDLGVADQVRWVGSRAAIGPVLSAVDLVLSASDDETFGMAVVEALGNGLPVVYVECPAVDALASHPTHALHVTASGDAAVDVDRLAAATAGALPRPGDARRPVPVELSERYGARAAADRVDRLYDTLLARAGARRA